MVDALVSNTNGKPCRFDPGPGYSRELWLNTIRDPVAHMNFRHALALPTERTPLALVGDPKSREIIKGQAGDIKIRYMLGTG